MKARSKLKESRHITHRKEKEANRTNPDEYELEETRYALFVINFHVRLPESRVLSAYHQYLLLYIHKIGGPRTINDNNKN